MPNALPNVPSDLSDQLALRRFLSELRNQVNASQGAIAPPPPPSNLTATGVAGGNLIQFTRSTADAYTLWWSPTANVMQATVIDLGAGAEYTDPTGQGGVTRYYWVQARSNSSGAVSARTGPVKATSLAPGTAASVPAPPPGNQQPAVNQQDDTSQYLTPQYL